MKYTLMAEDKTIVSLDIDDKTLYFKEIYRIDNSEYEPKQIEATRVEVMESGNYNISFKDGMSIIIAADELEKALVKNTNTKKLPKTGKALLGYGLSIVSVIVGAFGIKKKFRK